MISFAEKPFTKEENLNSLNENVREWFIRNFKDLTPPQYFSFKLIHRNENVLITAPTGSGKTLSAFTVILSELFNLAHGQKLEDMVYCIYVSPLKALNNDTVKNLIIPLKEVREIARKKGKELPEVRIGLRTGDVPASEKQKQLRLPPHILITTPESLAILINSPKFSEKLKRLRWIVIDEIHELANNKRGAHLSLSIERLRELTDIDFIRIGLGATIYPLEEAARFLVGFNASGPRNCKIVDVSWFKKYDLQVLCPTKDLIYAEEDEITHETYKLLHNLIQKYRTTLIFTNTRSGTERVVFNLKRIYGKYYNDDNIAAHHGSLSKDIRWDVEEKLKRGELKAVICSTSLELGIDIGYIDLVVQIGSPKSITRAIQRIGRSGHKLTETAKGRLIVMDRDDLVECSVMLSCTKQKILDYFNMPKNCLDVLAQHIVGMSLSKQWDVDDAYNLVRRSYVYRELKKEDFISLLHYLAGHHVALEDRKVYAKIWFEEKENTFGRRGRLVRLIYYLNIGTIPDEVAIGVFTSTTNWVGDIQEEFLSRLKKGDIFVLGGKTYQFRHAKGMRCYVAPVKGLSPTIPPWFSEQLPLSYELALQINKFREEMRKAIKVNNDEKVNELLNSLPINNAARTAIKAYFTEQFKYLGIIPTDKALLIESTIDMQKRNFVVFHSLFGRRVNDALSRVFSIITSETINIDVGVISGDNGFALILPENTKFTLGKIIELACKADTVKLLQENLRRTEMMKRRFRHCASRSFLVLRNYKGYRFSVSRQQLSAQTLLNVCEDIDKNFPIIKETYREILEDTMDINKANLVLGKIKSGEIKYKHVSTTLPSPFAHNIILMGEADIILMKDRRKRLIELHKELLSRIGEKVGN